MSDELHEPRPYRLTAARAAARCGAKCRDLLRCEAPAMVDGPLPLPWGQKYRPEDGGRPRAEPQG